jgi:hypothetical protein
MSTHWPLAHWSAVVWTALVHDPGAHTVPSGYGAQAPLAPHSPLVPQDAAPWSAQSSSGSVPASTVPHSPSRPPLFFAAVQALQALPQARSQHTPSLQLPREQSDPERHGCPSAHLLQTPPQSMAVSEPFLIPSPHVSTQR